MSGCKGFSACKLGLGLVAMLMLSACSSGMKVTHASLDPADWQQYKKHFVAAEGRVMDNRNALISHSEGQGYAMLLAVAYRDQVAFDHIWQWTQKNLQVRKQDKLHAWKWAPEAKGVVDMNNATDGDVAIAWALQRAYRQWQQQEYLDASGAILASLRKLLIKTSAGLFLLPGEKGFRNMQTSVLNPSYLLFPAYRDFAAQDKETNWQQLTVDARRLLKQAAFGHWHLPSNWLQVDFRVRMAPDREAYFGYDAMRIPLFAAWAGERALLTPYVSFWNQFSMLKSVPDQVDLNTDFVHMSSEFAAVRSIAALSRHVHGKSGEAVFPGMQWAPDTAYYDASLTLLSQLAWIEFDQQQESSR